MFSDIAGYTLIMGRDEDKAVRALAEHRRVLRSLLPKFSGRLIGEIGDGTLSSFHSALDAVNCAREVQSTLLGDPELQLRIGIHVGDVLFQDNTVLGDGVNVASRIHSLAPPGGICVSERVYDDIRNKPEIDARSLGEKTLKNVSHPIKVYAITNAGSSRVPAGLASGPDSVAPKAITSARTLTLIVSLALVFAGLIGVAAYSRFRTSTTLAPSLPQSSPSHVDLNIAFCQTSDGVRIAYATVARLRPCRSSKSFDGTVIWSAAWKARPRQSTCNTWANITCMSAMTGADPASRIGANKTFLSMRECVTSRQ